MVVVACSSCGKQTKNDKFCSRSCSARVTNVTYPKRTRVWMTCRCGRQCRRRYCSQVCQQEDRYEKYVTAWLAGDESGTTPTGWMSDYVRRWIRETYGDKCSRCGWAELHPVTGVIPVQVDHIDGNGSHNRPENLRLLCPNCHSLTPNYMNLNRGNGHWSRKRNYARQKSRADVA